MKKRLNFVDISRGLAMIFIVLGHTLVHSEHCNIIFKLLYSFHVVLFFVVSGYTFKIKNDKSFIEFIKNKFIRIMIPYFIWGFLFLIPYMILGGNVGNTLGTTSSFNLKTQIINVIYGNGNMSALKQNSSLWFLPALFTMEVIYYFIIDFINKNEKYKIFILLPLLLITYVSTNFLNILLPWGINTALNVGIFFYIGYLLNEYKIFEKDSKWLKPYILILVLLIGLISCFFNKDTVSCIDYKYGNVTLALLSGLCLSISTIYIAFIINKNKILEYIGKNTMGILIFHKLVILIIQTKLGIISQLLIKSNIIIELLLSIFAVFISIICSLMANNILKRICPIVIGEKIRNEHK